MNVISYSISDAFLNKSLRPGVNQSAYGYSYTSVTNGSIDLLCAHIKQGNAWTPALFSGGRNVDNWKQAQLIGMDCDHNVSIETALLNETVKNYVAILHPTANSTPENPRTRLVFILDQVITDANEYHYLQRALGKLLLPLLPDMAVCHPSVQFYGALDTQGQKRPDKILPVAVLEPIVKQLKADDETAKQKQTVAINGDLPANLIQAVELLLGVSGHKTNDKGFTVPAVPCPITTHEHDNQSPAFHWNRDGRFGKCFKCLDGGTFNTKEIATAFGLNIKDFNQPRPKPSLKPKLTDTPPTTDGVSPEPSPTPIKTKPEIKLLGLKQVSTLTKEEYVFIVENESLQVAGTKVGLTTVCQTQSGKWTKENVAVFTALWRKIKMCPVIVCSSLPESRKWRDELTQQLMTTCPGLVDFGRNDGFTLEKYIEYWTQKGENVLLKLETLIEYDVAAKIVTSEQAGETVDKLIEGKISTPPRGNILMIPWKSLHRFGGATHYLIPPALVAIAAPSGHGKTTLIETFADSWMKQGFDVLMYGVEWDEIKVHYKRIQRHGITTYDELVANEVYLLQEAAGIPEDKRAGKRLSSELQKKVQLANDKILAWPGKMWHFPIRDDLDETLADMLDIVRFRRRYDLRVGACVWDYEQLLRTGKEENGRNSHEIIVDKLKRFCIKHSVVGILGVQVTKNTGRNYSNDTLIGMYDMAWVTPNAFTLILTINRETDSSTGAIAAHTLLNVAKNNTGLTGCIPCEFAGKYFMFQETKS